ncbi:hypothetical protein [Vibrio hyugaensis]|uniref:hypothetical protein n=1 Tax=Vibrio hyugaensis TaxID=1534743 RepID=UPI003D9FEB6D
MKFFPTPPTDNLYKFHAILGSWLVGASLVLYVLIKYVSYDLELQLADQSHHMRTERDLVKVNERLESIAKGNLEENKVSWVRGADGSPDEVAYLKQLKENFETSIQVYKDTEKIDYGRIFDIVEATDLWWIIGFLMFIAGLLFYSGFKNWYYKVQKPQDELIQLDLKIKRLTLLEMERESKKRKKFKATL